MTKRASRRGLWTAVVLAAGLGGLALVAPPLTPGTIESAPVTVITTTPPSPVVPLTPEELSARVVPTIVTITAPAGFTTTAGDRDRALP